MIMRARSMASGFYNHNRSTAGSISITRDNPANNLNLIWKSIQKQFPFVTLLHNHLLEILYLDSLISTVLSCDVEEL